jgi:hypothetical protein
MLPDLHTIPEGRSLLRMQASGCTVTIPAPIDDLLYASRRERGVQDALSGTANLSDRF